MPAMGLVYVYHGLLVKEKKSFNAAMPAMGLVYILKFFDIQYLHGFNAAMPAMGLVLAYSSIALSTSMFQCCYACNGFSI